MNANLEDAKFRYMTLWNEYRQGVDEERSRKLEIMMDKAQNYFSFNEFQEFKKELEGFEEFWDNWYIDHM